MRPTGKTLTRSSTIPVLLTALLAALLAVVGFGCTAGGDNRPRTDASLNRDSGRPATCDNRTDSDGDGLFDVFELDNDTDRDGTPNYLDTDSDNDGIPDSEEAPPTDGCSARDTDGDGFFDFIDNDSDNDGLGDAEERGRYSTDPYSEDSDGDGFTDAAEVATGHNPNNSADGIPPDDFYLVLPYESDAQFRELTFGTTVRKADVFFMVDRTGSMSEEISRLKSSLAGTIVPALVSTLTDVGVGFGGFAGFGGPAGGTCGFGFGCDGPDGDTPFHLYSTITTNPTQMQADVMMLDADQGGATWASSNEALYQAATGEGIAPWVPRQSCVAVPDEIGVRYGYPCFRPGALPVMVVMTDTSSHNGPLCSPADNYDPANFTMGPPPHTYDAALASLNSISARVIGVISGEEVSSPTPISQFREWATRTGTVDASGNPIAFTIASNGSGLDTSVVEAIRTLAEETPQDISATARDGADFPEGIPPVDAVNFIKAITPVALTSGASRTDCPTAGVCDERRFYSVTPGGTVSFRIRFRNDFLPAIGTVQILRATIVVLGNGVAELDTREVVILVPAGSDPEILI